jgi:hypothetical protein
MGENVPPNSESVGDDEFGKNCDSQSSQFVASPNRVQKKQGDQKLIRAAVAAVVQRKRTLNREHCLIHCAAIRYHFIIAVWTAKQAQAAAYENESTLSLILLPLFACFSISPTAQVARPSSSDWAEAEGRLPRLPTGDGAALVFRTHAEGGYCVR